MNCKKVIGFGVLIWMINFTIASIFVALKVSPNTAFAGIILTIFSAIAVLVIAGYVKPKDFKEAIQYGIFWAVTGIVLDALISSEFAPGIFAKFSYWLGCLLIVILPLFRIKKTLNLFLGQHSLNQSQQPEQPQQ